MILAGGLPGFGRGIEVIAFLVLAAMVAIVAGAIYLGRFAWRRSRIHRYATPRLHQTADPTELRRGLKRVRHQLDSVEPGTDDEFRLRLRRAEYAQALGEDAGATRARLAEVVPLGLARLDGANLDRFVEILFLTVAFGTEEQRRAAAGKWNGRRVEEDEFDYRVALGEGVVELIEGNRAAARAQFAYAAKADPRRMLAWIAAAGVSIADHDQEMFGRQIMASLVEYGSDYTNLPAEPAGVMNVFALALCRLGLEDGLRVTEMAYLPLQLLPQTTAIERA